MLLALSSNACTFLLVGVGVLCGSKALMEHTTCMECSSISIPASFEVCLVCMCVCVHVCVGKERGEESNE